MSSLNKPKYFTVHTLTLLKNPLFQAILICALALIVSHSIRREAGLPADASLILTTLFFCFLACYVSAAFLRFLINSSVSSSLAYVIPVQLMIFGTLSFGFVLTRLQYSRLEFFSTALGSFVIATILTAISDSMAEKKLFAFEDSNLFSQLPLTDHNLQIFKIDETKPFPETASARIILCYGETFSPGRKKFITEAALSGVQLIEASDTIELINGFIPATDVVQITRSMEFDSNVYVVIKRAIDFIAAILLFPLFAFAIFLAAVAIKWDDGGDVFFFQKRIGYRGKPFFIIKLRSMRNEKDLDRVSGYGLKNDSRITRVGKYIRRFRIDEFPQIINILKGEMSWIGPRPETAEHVEWYKEKIELYDFRHIVRPGITGWAAVKQGHHIGNVDLTRTKLYFDFFYIKHFSFKLDVLVTLKTIKTILTGFGAK